MQEINENAPAIVNETSISTVNVDQALQEWNAYQEITEKMLDESDYQNIKGKMYKKKAAWRKYARAFNINTEILKEEVLKTEKGRVIEATFVVRATLPTGRYADGWGNCSKFEKNRNNPNHDIPATAMTRATNRAIADLIGAGEVTADEIQSESTYHARQNAKNKPKKQEQSKENVIEAEVVSDKNEFTTADKVEPLDETPVVVTYAKNVAKEVKHRGLSINQRNMKLKAHGMLKRGEIPSEYKDELLSFIEENCPGDDN